jgi:tripartite-type tricarboxylate transporter receptor subunit TctC
MKSAFFPFSLLFCLLLASVGASAQYPVRPIHLIVPFPAGGPSDNAARTLGHAMAKSMGQPVVVENRPGADGAIGPQAVASAAPDGYTLLYGVSSMVALPLLRKDPPFNPLKDFTPVSIIGRFAFCMYVNPDVPAKSVAEFIAYARANPDKLNYAASNNSEFMAAAHFMKAAGIRMVRVPYKGASQAMPDLIAGRVQVGFGPIAAGLPYVQEGRLRMLASFLPQRSALTPDVPTMAESGLAAVSVPSWQALFAPTKTPKEIVDRLSREVKLALRDPDVVAQFERQALRIEGSSPEALTAAIQEDLRTWAQFFRENAIAAD